MVRCRQIPNHIEQKIKTGRAAGLRIPARGSAHGRLYPPRHHDCGYAGAPGVRLREVLGVEFLQRTFGPSAKRANAKGLRFTTAMTGLDAIIRLDETRIRQILSNLAGNAVAYTQEGEVAIAAGYESTEKGAFLTVVIGDTGVGMPQGTAQNVLQPFVRGLDSAQIDPQGLGMGLAIVQSHLTELGGTLSIESAPGGGTKVCVTIPCSTVNLASEVGVRA
jgi:two-component system, NarL family, sensor histidine kinase EvgS